MKYFKIEYGCGCSPNEEYIECETLKEAEETAWEYARDDYESYAGLHGIPSVEEVAEELFGKEWDDLSEEERDEAWSEYEDGKESWIDYSAIEITYEEYLEEADRFRVKGSF